VEPAAVAARAQLAAQLGIPQTSVTIGTVEEKTWNNGCLGLAASGEFCTQALVEGFRVALRASGQTYIYRTDRTGVNVRLESN
jgi:hypothetical protein